MAETSAGTSVRTVSDLSQGLLQKLRKLGGGRPRSDADYAVPSDDSAELMLVTRNFLYAMPEANDATCAFPNISNEAADNDDEPMDNDMKAEEEKLIRLARHLLFACGNMRVETFKHVVLFIVGSFGRHCRQESCNRGEACSLRGLVTYDPTKPEDYVDAVLKLSTPIVWFANSVIQMRTDALSRGRLSMFEHVTEGHAALLASLVYPSACSKSLKAKCFELFGSYIAADSRFRSTTPAQIASILRTFDGHTKTYFQATPEDCTETVKARMAAEMRRDFDVHEFGEKIIFKKTRRSNTAPAAANAAEAGAAAGGDSEAAPPEMSWNLVKEEYDAIGSTLIPKLALGEMKAEPEDDPKKPRRGQFALQPTGAELVVGAVLSTRSDAASKHIPPMTVRRFPRIVFDPVPPHKALTYAGGGEASALVDIADLKRRGRVFMTPDYEHPAPVLEALTMDEIRAAGDPNFNRFRGFHGDHAYAAFHPSDVKSHGVYTPDMHIAPDLVQAGAQGYLAAGAAMMLPTVAAFFKVGTEVTAEAYAAGAPAIRKHCVGLGPYLTNAAKWHHRNTVGQLNEASVVTATTTLETVVDVVRNASTFATLVTQVDENTKGKPKIEQGNKRAAATVLKLAASFYPQVLAEYDEMIKEYADWRQRQDEGMRKPEFYFNGATEKAQRIRRAATLTMCGYIFLPDSADGIGVTGVFQMSGMRLPTRPCAPAAAAPAWPSRAPHRPTPPHASRARSRRARCGARRGERSSCWHHRFFGTPPRAVPARAAARLRGRSIRVVAPRGGVASRDGSRCQRHAPGLPPPCSACSAARGRRRRRPPGAPAVAGGERCRGRGGGGVHGFGAQRACADVAAHDDARRLRLQVLDVHGVAAAAPAGGQHLPPAVPAEVLEPRDGRLHAVVSPRRENPKREKSTTKMIARHRGMNI